MSIRDDIVARAKWWAEPGTYAPTAWDFLHICDEAGIVPGPSHADLRYTEANLHEGGVQIGGQRKEWCGIFAVAVWAHCGVGAVWTLNYKEYNKNILSAPGLPFEKRTRRTGIRRGDIAFVNDHKHHFIITEVNGDLASTVEGNQAKNTIRTYHLKHLTSVTAYYTVLD